MFKGIDGKSQTTLNLFTSGEDVTTSLYTYESERVQRMDEVCILPSVG